MFKVCYDYDDNINWKENVVVIANTYNEAFAIASDYIRNTLNVKPHYFRVWGDFNNENGLTIDYGSHSRFIKVIWDDE